MNQVRPMYFPRRRLNPERPTVWFVGREGSGPLDKIELELLPEGMPYMVPSWWTGVWGPFTKEEAIEIIAGRKGYRHASPPVVSRDEPAVDESEFVPEEPQVIRPSEEPGIVSRARQRRRGITRGPVGDRIIRGRPGSESHAMRGAATIRSYDDAMDLLVGHAARQRGRTRWDGVTIRLGRNTRMIVRGDNFAIRYHECDIVTYLPNSTVIVNTCGWPTPTTMQRINTFLPAKWSLGIKRTRARRYRDAVRTYYGFRQRTVESSIWMVYSYTETYGWREWGVYEDGIELMGPRRIRR